VGKTIGISARARKEEEPLQQGIHGADRGNCGWISQHLLAGLRSGGNTGVVDVPTRLGKMHQLLSSQHSDVRPLVLEPPATRRQIADVELALGLEPPSTFREVLLTVSSHMEFVWFAGDRQFARPFHRNFSGDLHWSLDQMVHLESERRSWFAAVFPNLADPYDAVWHDKPAFYEVGNGDFLAFDLAAETYGQVVYLCHDDGEGHGYVLAQDFQDLLARWLPLACAGGEDWQLRETGA
jgi:cell wall assembly regulator SMI1